MFWFSYPAHCSQCKFDLCDNCIKPYKSRFHPGHVMYKADSNVAYPGFNGVWRCDRCSRSFKPQTNNVPYHCSQCEFDLCDSCMTTTGDVSNAGRISSNCCTISPPFVPPSPPSPPSPPPNVSLSKF